MPPAVGATPTDTTGVGDDDDEVDPSCTQRTVRRTRTLTRAVSVYKVRFGVHSIQNERPEMEDAHCARLGLGDGGIPDLTMLPGSGLDKTTKQGTMEGVQDVSPPVSPPDSPKEESAMGSFSYFAVFDGHGGARAAEFASERMANLLAVDQARLVSDPSEALRQAFLKTEAEWHQMGLENEYMDGTTAAVALVDHTTNRAVVGNVGDSEVLIGTRDKTGAQSHRMLTEVHQLKRSEAEQQRITQVGGRLWRGRLGHPKINPLVCSLAVSRSIGDIYFKAEQYTSGKPSGLIADPFITSVDIRSQDVDEQFLLIGCDGLWDTVSYQEAADFVFAQLKIGADPQAISEALVALARDAGSSDNITVMVVVLVI